MPEAQPDCSELERDEEDVLAAVAAQQHVAKAEGHVQVGIAGHFGDVRVAEKVVQSIRT